MGLPKKSPGESIIDSSNTSPLLRLLRTDTLPEYSEARGLASLKLSLWRIDLRTGRAEITPEGQVLFENVFGVSHQCLDEGRFGFIAHVHPDDRDMVLGLLAGISGDTQTNTANRIAQSFRFRTVDVAGEIRWIELQVAFDLETPLDTLWLIAREISTQLTIEETQKRELANRILSSILTSQQGHGLDEEPLESIQQNELHDLVVEKWQSEIEKRRIRWIGPDLALLNPQVSVMFSKHLFLLAIDSLFENSIDWINTDGQLHGWIRCELFNDDHSVYLALTDSGFGIPLSNRGRIFDPFYSSKKSHAAGLGLTLARAAIEWMGGSLRLDQFNRNTRFVIQLPITL